MRVGVAQLKSALTSSEDDGEESGGCDEDKVGCVFEVEDRA